MTLLTLPGNIFDDSLWHFITVSDLLATSCASIQTAAVFAKKFEPEVLLNLLKPKRRGGKQRATVRARSLPASSKTLPIHMEMPLWCGEPSLEKKIMSNLPSPKKWWSRELTIKGFALKSQKGRCDASLDTIVEQVPTCKLRYLVLTDIHAATFLPSCLTENAELDLLFCECPSDGILGRLHQYPKCMSFGWV